MNKLKNNRVVVIDHGERVIFASRSEAMAEYLEGAMCCDGSEALGYLSIYEQLASGADIATDN